MTINSDTSDESKNEFENFICVLGIVGFLINYSLIFWISIIISSIAILLGLISRINKVDTNKTNAGLVIGVIGLILSIGRSIYYAFFWPII